MRFYFFYDIWGKLPIISLNNFLFLLFNTPVSYILYYSIFSHQYWILSWFLSLFPFIFILSNGLSSGVFKFTYLSLAESDLPSLPFGRVFISDTVFQCQSLYIVYFLILVMFSLYSWPTIFITGALWFNVIISVISRSTDQVYSKCGSYSLASALLVSFDGMPNVNFMSLGVGFCCASLNSVDFYQPYNKVIHD